MKIEDNFLKQEEFDKIQNLLMGDTFPWYYNPTIDLANDEDKYQFIHLFYDAYIPISVNIKIINPLVYGIKPISLWRVKANLLTRTPNIIENTFHTDIGKLIDKPEKLAQWTTSIFYVNTNNGYTKFEDGTKVESVANRVVTFPANMKHHGTSCTNEKTRVVINFNYFEDTL